MSFCHVEHRGIYASLCYVVGGGLKYPSVTCYGGGLIHSPGTWRVRV